MGYGAGGNTQGANSVAIGLGAGFTTQGNNAVAVGPGAAETNQSANAIAIGRTAGENGQGPNAIAIGVDAGGDFQGADSIAIGRSAGFIFGNTQANNSIVLNATGVGLNANVANTFIVQPVRGLAGANSNASFRSVFYNPTTGEFVYNT
jgi:hypothetical protein